MRDDAWQDDLLDTTDLGGEDVEEEACSRGRSLNIANGTWLAHEANPVSASYVPENDVGQDNGRNRH